MANFGLSVKIASFEATVNTDYECDTTAGNITVTIPDPAADPDATITFLVRGSGTVTLSRPVNGVAAPTIRGSGTIVQLLSIDGAWHTGAASLHDDSVRGLVGVRPSVASSLGGLAGVLGYQRAYRVPLAAGANGLAGYQFRLRIGESPLATGTDFIIRAGVFPAAEGDGGDFMFVRQNGTEVRFTVERVTGVAPNRTAHVWVALPNGTAADVIFLLTHSSIATPNRDRADLVWNFWEPFDGTALDAARWTSIDSTGVTVAAGSMRHTSSSARIRSVPTFGDNIVVETLWRPVSPPANGHIILGLANPVTIATNAIGYLYHGGNTDFLRTDATWTGVGASLTGIETLSRLEIVDFPLLATDLVTITHENYATGAQIRQNIGTKTVTALPIMLGRRYDADAWLGQAMDASWRWMRVRQAASAPSIGAVTEV